MNILPKCPMCGSKTGNTGHFICMRNSHYYCLYVTGKEEFQYRGFVVVLSDEETNIWTEKTLRYSIPLDGIPKDFSFDKRLTVQEAIIEIEKLLVLV